MKKAMNPFILMKIKSVLSALAVSFFFVFLGEKLVFASLALPILFYNLVTDKEAGSVLKEYTHRITKGIYFLTVSIVLLSLRYELKTTYFYNGMSSIDRIGIAFTVSAICVLVIAIANYSFEHLLIKIKKK